MHDIANNQRRLALQQARKAVKEARAARSCGDIDRALRAHAEAAAHWATAMTMKALST